MEKLELVFDFGPCPAADFAAHPLAVGAETHGSRAAPPSGAATIMLAVPAVGGVVE
jgi:hypothetical protein